MTAGERLIQQGVQQGVQQGERKLLLHQLRKRFGQEINAAIEQRIADASVERLEIWAERVLSTATLAELMAD
jgi:hypothetical protein